MKCQIPENMSKVYRRPNSSIPGILAHIFKGVAHLAASFSCCPLLVGFQDSKCTSVA